MSPCLLLLVIESYYTIDSIYITERQHFIMLRSIAPSSKTELQYCAIHNQQLTIETRMNVYYKELFLNPAVFSTTVVIIVC